MHEMQTIENKQRDEFLKLYKDKMSGEWLSGNNHQKLIRLYLMQPEWKNKRDQVGIRCNNVCERCKSAPYQECHHLHYKNLFREKLEDLLGVCAPCHKELTLEQKGSKVSISKKHSISNGTKKMRNTSAQLHQCFVENIKEFAGMDKVDFSNVHSVRGVDFRTILVHTGLISNKHNDTWYVTPELKALAERSSEEIMGFRHYFNVTLAVCPANEDLMQGSPLLTEKSKQNSGKIKSAYRRYHPLFSKLFELSGIGNPNSTEELKLPVVSKTITTKKLASIPVAVAKKPFISKNIDTKKLEEEVMMKKEFEYLNGEGHLTTFEEYREFQQFRKVMNS
jgi:hypothetical protein